jgi:hypothetical protein
MLDGVGHRLAGRQFQAVPVHRRPRPGHPARPRTRAAPWSGCPGPAAGPGTPLGGPARSRHRRSRCGQQLHRQLAHPPPQLLLISGHPQRLPSRSRSRTACLPNPPGTAIAR